MVQLGASIALSHHERFDGSGYPRKLAGSDIPIEGRIVAVADVFDAITSERPYKRPWPIDLAIDYLQRESGMHFDPRCVEAFLNSIDEVLVIYAQTPHNSPDDQPTAQLLRAGEQ